MEMKIFDTQFSCANDAKIFPEYSRDSRRGADNENLWNFNATHGRNETRWHENEDKEVWSFNMWAENVQCLIKMVMKWEYKLYECYEEFQFSRTHKRYTRDDGAHVTSFSSRISTAARSTPVTLSNHHQQTTTSVVWQLLLLIWEMRKSFAASVLNFLPHLQSTSLSLFL